MIGITTASTPASAPGKPAKQEFPSPESVASSSCASQTLLYAQAYMDYADSLDDLNDAWEALYECQNGGGEYVPSDELRQDLAGMKTVLENR